MPPQFGLVGHPIGHSLSQAMHGAAFDQLGLDHQYDLFDVIKEDLGLFMKNAKEKGMIGCNVTIPHKVEIIKYMDELSNEAELIGAVNTIKFGKKVMGYNTDGIGCVRALNEAGIDLKDKRILLLGAGGAARAIGFQCTLEGASVSISNRESERYMAEDLSLELEKKLKKPCPVITMDDKTIEKELKSSDILINSTPVGMNPNVDQSVIPEKIIPKNIAVMDIVYNPIKTKLLKAAKKRGCKTVSGVGMLVHQGAESERIWLGVEPPVKLMYKVVEERLKG